MAKAKVAKKAKSAGVLGWIRTLLLLVIAVLALTLGVWISVDNPQEVSLVLMGFSLPEVALGVLVTGLLLLGAVLGFLVSLIPALRITSENLSLKRKLKRRDQELERLRKAPLTE